MMTTDLILFFLFALVAVGSALGLLFSRNAVYAALFLVLNFITVAIFYLFLNAPFLAMAQVTVYAGAIMVLFLFVIMLLNLKTDVRGFVLGKQQRITALVLGCVAFLLIVIMIVPVTLYQVTPDKGALSDQEFGKDNLQAVGKLLYSRYLIPFEIASVLLIVAMIGAVVLAKKELE